MAESDADTHASAATKGVSPVVWIGLAAVAIAGGIYAYARFVPPEPLQDFVIDNSDADDPMQALAGQDATVGVPTEDDSAMSGAGEVDESAMKETLRTVRDALADDEKARLIDGADSDLGGDEQGDEGAGAEGGKDDADSDDEV